MVVLGEKMTYNNKKEPSVIMLRTAQRHPEKIHAKLESVQLNCNVRTNMFAYNKVAKVYKAF